MKYYCIGIKGSGMATLACLLSDLGNDVSGYDDVKDYKFTQKGLDSRNIPIFYDNIHEIDKDTIVTASRAFSEDHPEIKRIHELGLTFKAYNEIIGELTDKFKTVSVCGTHGKTTTTSIISHVALDYFKECNYFIGDGRGNASKNSDLFVIESDEFNRHFLAYHPTISVMTNIELEHTECYSDIDDIINTFSKFGNVNTKDMIIACGDNENIRKIDFNKKVIYYGFNDNNEFIAKNINITEAGSSFDVYHNHEFIGNYMIPLFGKHMVLNSLASIIALNYLGIDYDFIKESFKNFKNAERRFSETKIGNIVTIDDYAHHPTEIKVTLEAAKSKYPDKELIAIFKPNTYSRTKQFPKEFGEALDVADRVYVTEIDCNRENPNDYPGVSSKIILDNTKSGKIISEDTIDEITNIDNCVVCFMSCASISHLKEKYESLIKKD